MTFLRAEKRQKKNERVRDGEKEIRIKFNFSFDQFNFYLWSLMRNWVREKSHECEHQRNVYYYSISWPICATLITNTHTLYGINSMDWLVMVMKWLNLRGLSHTHTHMLYQHRLPPGFWVCVRNSISFSLIIWYVRVARVYTCVWISTQESVPFLSCDLPPSLELSFDCPPAEFVTHASVRMKKMLKELYWTKINRQMNKQTNIHVRIAPA